LPYALTVGFVAIFAGTLPAAYGVSCWLLFPLALLLLWAIIRWWGKPTELAVK
jgi:hypothetical protein